MKTEKQDNTVVQSAESSESIKRGILKMRQRIYRAVVDFTLQIKNMLEPTCLETDTSGSEERRSE